MLLSCGFSCHSRPSQIFEFNGISKISSLAFVSVITPSNRQTKTKNKRATTSACKY